MGAGSARFGARGAFHPGTASFLQRSGSTEKQTHFDESWLFAGRSKSKIRGFRRGKKPSVSYPFVCRPESRIKNHD